jgi:hypothetical protein
MTVPWVSRSRGDSRRRSHGTDVRAGEGDQVAGDGEPFPVLWIAKRAFHSPLNRGWEPMVILAVYAPPRGAGRS